MSSHVLYPAIIPKLMSLYCDEHIIHHGKSLRKDRREINHPLDVTLTQTICINRQVFIGFTLTVLANQNLEAYFNQLFDQLT